MTDEVRRSRIVAFVAGLAPIVLLVALSLIVNPGPDPNDPLYNLVMIPYVVALIIASILGGRAASKLHRSAWSWGLLAFFLAALPLCVLAFRKPGTPRQSEPHGITPSVLPPFRASAEQPATEPRAAVPAVAPSAAPIPPLPAGPAATNWKEEIARLRLLTKAYVLELDAPPDVPRSVQSDLTPFWPVVAALEHDESVRGVVRLPEVCLLCGLSPGKDIEICAGQGLNVWRALLALHATGPVVAMRGRLCDQCVTASELLPGIMLINHRRNRWRRIWLLKLAVLNDRIASRISDLNRDRLLSWNTSLSVWAQVKAIFQHHRVYRSGQEVSSEKLVVDPNLWRQIP